MGSFLGGFVLPLLLLTAAVLEWSLISFVDLLAFFAIQFTAPRLGFQIQRSSVLWCIVIFSVISFFAQIIFHVIWTAKGEQWSIANAWWAKLIGFVSFQPWRSTSVIYYFLATQLAAALVALIGIYGHQFGLVQWRNSCWGKFSSSIERLGSHLRVACCLLLPAVQLVVGISHPSWVSLPFFICSCVGVVDWSLTSNFLGLFRLLL